MVNEEVDVPSIAFSVIELIFFLAHNCDSLIYIIFKLDDVDKVVVNSVPFFQEMEMTKVILLHNSFCDLFKDAEWL